MSTAQTLPDIIVSALALVRDRRVLMVTARGRDVYFMPGGKVDAGESAVDALVRESEEEVALQLDPASATELFEVATQAHGEPEGRLVRMRVFAALPAPGTDPAPRPNGEVSAVHWCTSADIDRCPPAGRRVIEELARAGLID